MSTESNEDDIQDEPNSVELLDKEQNLAMPSINTEVVIYSVG